MSEMMVQDFIEQEDTQRGKYLTFSLGEEFYGIEIKYVTEIIGVQPITQVPDIPKYIQGIINLRGQIIPVMDVRLRFNKDFREYNDRTCIIVIEIDEICIGLIVDSVAEVAIIPEEAIVPPPEFNQLGNKYIKGIGKCGEEVKLLLHAHRLLTEEEIENLTDLN